MQFKTAGVIGAGAWGTALAQVAGWAGLDVLLQAREPEVVESIRTRRINEAFLPGVVIDDRVSVTGDLADLGACDLILAVPPAQHMRSTLQAFAAHHRPGVPVILCSKGIERGSLKLMTDVLAETLPAAPAAVLSGPSFAGEVARGLPSAVTLACADEALGEALIDPLGFRYRDRFARVRKVGGLAFETAMPFSEVGAFIDPVLQKFDFRRGERIRLVLWWHEIVVI
jgi:glycerol-3-phosphate dehydrogenase (NAD(P)+)